MYPTFGVRHIYRTVLVFGSMCLNSHHRFIVFAFLALSCLMAGARDAESKPENAVSVETTITAVAAADLTIADERVEKSTSWGPKMFSPTSLEQRKANLIVELCREVGADVLVDPQFTYSKRFLGAGKLTVSGYPAKYKSFRSMSEAEIDAFITTPEYKEGKVVFINK